MGRELLRTDVRRLAAKPAPPHAGPGHNSRKGRKTVYAIAFDLDTKILQEAYDGQSWQNAYAEIGRVLSGHGFERQQGSVYFGDDSVDAVTCVLAVQDVAGRYPWFSPSVSDIRMLRIEENNDLMPAVERGAESNTRK